MNKVVVIGAGFAGLSAAANLAYKGYKVTLIEKNNQTGGRAMILNKNGFKFDMGPSWYMMTDVFDNFFKNLGRDRNDYFKIKKLDPSYKVFFHDGTTAEISTEREKLKNVFERIEKGSFKKLEEHLSESKDKYDIAFKDFVYKNFKSIISMINFKLIRNIFKLGLLKSWQSDINRFFKSKKLQQLVSWHAVFVGGEPKNIPALYSLMVYVDMDLGIWYPEEGFHSLIKSMTSVCKELAVEIRLNEEVKKLNVENGKVSKVITDKGEYECDYVVGAGDYHHIEQNMLDEKHRTYKSSYWEKKALAPATYVIYLGINKKLNNLEHHNYFFSKGWDNHFKSLFDDPKWPNDPSIYISVPSKTDEKVAPEGKENVFILVPVAPGLDDNDSIREEIFNTCIKLLEQLTKQEIKETDIETKTIFSQRDHKKIYNAYKGNALGLAHTFFQSGYFRPAMKSKKIKNLYFAGHYTQPGTSTVMSTISGELVSEEINKDING